MWRIKVAAALAAASIVMAIPASVTASDGLDAVRDATAAFRDVAAAEAAGYGILDGQPLEQCIDEPGEGTMGFHYVNGDLVGDLELHPTAPEALLYIPTPDGGLRLAGVEYVVFAEAWDAENAAPPQVLGHDLHLVPEPNRYELPAFYELHAWVWKRNPSGTFYEWNPDVSCDASELPDTAVSTGGGGSDGAPASPDGRLLLPALFAASLVVASVVTRLGRRAPASGRT